MDRREEILGIGATLIDTVVHVEESVLVKLGLPKGAMITFDDLTPILSIVSEAKATVPGGSCANVIRGLAELGWSCALVGKVGDDSTGRWLFNDLCARGIDPYYLSGKSHTGRVLCLITPDGERTMCTSVGSSAELTGDDLEPNFFDGKGLVVIEGYTLHQKDLTKKAMELARGLGADVAFDLGNFQLVQTHKEQIWELLRDYVTIVFSNQSEATALTGVDPQEACRQLSTHCRYAVVTLGAKGCVVSHGAELIHLEALPVPHVADTTGAGDSFCTGFLDGVLRGLPLKNCAEQGLILSAAVIQQEGVALPSAEWARIRQLFI